MASVTKKTKLNLQIITPERVVFSGEVYEIILPTIGGEISVLPDHVPYLSALKPGIVSLSLEKDKAVKPFCRIQNGFVELNDNELSVLVNQAEEI